MNILDELKAHAKERVKINKEKVPVGELIRMAKGAPTVPSFLDALKAPGMSFICECKKASPSKGLIAEDFDYLNIAKDYEAAGAAAISVLTEPKWFLGSDRYLEEISRNVNIPCLRKDFTVDEYMIYEARALGASAVLLICAILDDNELKSYIKLAHELSMDAIVEAHDETEIDRGLLAGAKIVGVNNRNLKDFSVDTSNVGSLRALVPSDVVFVAESGINSPEAVKLISDVGADAVLVGEALMRADDKAKKLAWLRGLL